MVGRAFPTQTGTLIVGICRTKFSASLSEEEDDKSDSEGGDLDKQMGDLHGEEADKLDERLWGDDDEEEDEEEEDSKTEETGPGMDEVIERFPHPVVPRLRHHYHSLSFTALPFLVFLYLPSLFFFFSLPPTLLT